MSQLSTTHHRYRLTALFGVLLVFLIPASVAAIPLNEYQQNLKNAIVALDLLNESGHDFDSHLTETIEIVRTNLPQHQTVEFEGDTCAVDNSWLHKELDELEKSDDAPEKVG